MIEYEEQKKGIPEYLKLYEMLRHEIIHGVYPRGTKLPSKRVMADMSSLSTITVEHAYQLLCDEGYAESIERRGYFVVFRASDGFAIPNDPVERQRKVEPHVDIPTDFPFSVLAKTMRRVITDYGKSILDRSPNEGTSELRKAICAYLARSRRIHASPDQIVIGSGSEYLYGLIVALLGRDKKYAIESPSYDVIEKVYQASFVEPEKLPLDRDGIRSYDLWNSDADVLHITPFRSFPSGVTASASKRHEYLRWGREVNRIIVEDDFESEFSLSSKPEETLFSLSDKENVIYMNSFSRTISSSFRVGYMVLPRSLANCFKEKLGFYSCTVPTYIQYVLADLIQNGDFERHVNRVRRAMRNKMKKK